MSTSTSTHAHQLVRFGRVAWPLALGLFCLQGCTGPGASSSSAPPPRHHNWWNHYQRGVHHLDSGLFADARREFEIAMGIRPGAKYGYDHDRWREVTYGLHVIEAYFPNRELGVACYHLGDLSSAATYLERSLAQTPSGRAKYYANKVRQTLLLGTAVAPPDIVFDGGPDMVVTREAEVEIAGTARGSGGIAKLTIDGRRSFIELAEPEQSFQQSLSLSPTTNVVVATAEDLLGRRVTRQKIWVLDPQRPQFFIDDIVRDGAGWVVTGVCRDNRALRQVWVNQQEHPPPAGTSLGNRLELRIPIPSLNVPLRLRADDTAGNRQEVVFLPAELTQAQQVEGAVHYASADASPSRPSASASPPPDVRAPDLNLQFAGERIVVFEPFVFVEGWAEDGSGLDGVFIAGEPHLPEAEHGARRAYFSRRLKLVEGTNTISIQATDQRGNSAVETVEAVYRIPEHKTADYRLCMAIPPVVADSRPDLAAWTRRQLETAVLTSPPRFQLLERDQAGLEHILVEHRISLSELCNRDGALPVGEVAAAELLWFSGFHRQASGLTVIAKVVEARNGRGICFEDVYIPDPEDLEAFEYQLNGLNWKVERRFPLASGMISATQGGRATVNLGSRDGVRAGMRFVASRSTVDDPLRGALCRHGDRRVELVAEVVEADRCLTRILPADGREEVKVGDIAHAR